jgi:hypothetical protein
MRFCHLNASAMHAADDVVAEDYVIKGKGTIQLICSKHPYIAIKRFWK